MLNIHQSAILFVCGGGGNRIGLLSLLLTFSHRRAAGDYIDLEAGKVVIGLGV